jgi:DNA-binding transcriptional MerR regulator
MDRKRLSDNQIEFIKTHFGVNNARWIGDRIGISDDMVRYYARKMGLHTQIKPKKLSYLDKEYIKANYGNIKVKEISEKIGLTIRQVHYYASLLGVSRKRQDYDRELFIKLFPVTSYKELSKRFGVTIATIYRWGRDLDLEKVVCYKFKESDIKFVEQWYGLMTLQQIAEYLGKTRNQVVYMIQTLRIKKNETEVR